MPAVFGSGMRELDGGEKGAAAPVGGIPASPERS